MLGYYSLAPTSANYEQTPDSARRGLPRPAVPGFRLGRLATDRYQHGAGFAHSCCRSGPAMHQGAGEVGSVALFIDAKTERAAKWYEDRGAERLTGIPEGFPIPMVIPLKSLENALRAAGKL